MTSADRRLWITPTNPSGPTLGWDLFGVGSLKGGVGGWETLDRPRALDALEWVKQPKHTQQVTLVLNGVDTGGRSIEADLARLRSYGKPSAPGASPPLLQLSGPIEQPAPFTLWVMDDIEPVDAVELIRGDDGQLRQQAMALSLSEWTGATILLGPAAAARARAGK